MSETSRISASPQDDMDAVALAGRALAHLRAEGALRTIDGEFAVLLRRRFGADALVALAGALAMRAVALGHSGFALARAEDLLDALAVRATLPPIEAWRAALKASPVVACDSDSGLNRDLNRDLNHDRHDHDIRSDTHAQRQDRPVLLSFEDGRVSLWRYARYEQQLADALALRSDSGRVASATDAADDGAALANIADALRRLFALDEVAALDEGHALDSQDAGHKGIDRQAFAAWRALHRRLLLITGGPGTGKTTTVARLLALQLIDADLRGAASPRIALAAPTGRAAVRLGEAIAERVAKDLEDGRIDAGLAARIPRAATTLHRLLGSRPGRVGFRHHADHPLPFDRVVVDEASMIDLPLMAKLVAAVAPQARLILLGDPDQLPAVEAGDVLGALCAAAGEGLMLDTREREQAASLFGVAADVIEADVIGADVIGADVLATGVVETNDVARIDSDPSHALTTPLAGHRVHLLRGWRQAGVHGLQALTETVRRGDAEAAMTQLQEGHAALRWRHGELQELAVWLRETVLPDYLALRDAEGPAAALRCARRVRVLTALRRGPYGAEFWNAWCAAELGARETQFHGRLIAITENSARHGLYNGDLGVLWHDDIRHGHGEGGLVAWFETEGRLRAWRPGQLPAHATAFATTVHKAQGSEFDAVALLLPDADSRVLGRELLYTALTRARRRVLLWAAPTVLRRALERRSLRDSGLSARLQRLRAASME
jgi:exodeoxyribonuclease V alpha subunit